MCEDIIPKLEKLSEYEAVGIVKECQENKTFLEFLYSVINPNDMEKYMSMYNSKNEKNNV